MTDEQKQFIADTEAQIDLLQHQIAQVKFNSQQESQEGLLEFLAANGAVQWCHHRRGFDRYTLNKEAANEFRARFAKGKDYHWTAHLEGLVFYVRDDDMELALPGLEVSRRGERKTEAEVSLLTRSGFRLRYDRAESSVRFDEQRAAAARKQLEFDKVSHQEIIDRL